jgi:hypothetical protein
VLLTLEAIGAATKGRTYMKRIIKIAVLAAVAVLATAAVASASVAVDANGTGYVGKGDVQSALKWNNGDFDKNVANLKFTAGTQVMGNQTRWQCSGGEQSRTSTVVQSRTVKATEVLSSNGKQITGWNLTGFGYQYLGGGYSGAPYVGYCPAGESFGGFLPNVFTTDVTDGGLKVNGIDLPNTPVLAAA